MNEPKSEAIKDTRQPGLAPATCSASRPKITQAEKELLEKIAKTDSDHLQSWREKFEEAKRNVEYWERQVEHSSALSIRATMDSWQ